LGCLLTFVDAFFGEIKYMDGATAVVNLKQFETLVDPSLTATAQ
jgi:hypothetical protein